MADNTTLSIAVLSGKGGVGKSNLTLNLGYVLNALGNKVLLVDCDMGLANLDVLLGITPKHDVGALLADEMAPTDVIVPISQNGGHAFDLLPASSGILEASETQYNIPDRLVDKLRETLSAYDYVLLDVGAGISPLALSFGAMAMLRLVVITPEPTSLTDSYALIKVMASRYSVRDHFVVVNNYESEQEERMAHKRLAAACEHFLGIAPSAMGAVRSDPRVSEAVRAQKPFYELYPECPAGQDIAELARKVNAMRVAMLGRIASLTPLRDLHPSRPETLQKNS